MLKREMREIENGLLVALATRVQPQGFVLRRSHQDYVKSTSSGRWVLHVAFIEHDDDFDVTADVALRLDAVQDLVHRDNPDLSQKEKRETATAGAELGNIADGRQERWTVADITSVDPVADAIYRTFVGFGLPYLERLSDPRQLLDELATNDRRSWLHAPFHGWRNKTAVALALILSDRQRADELARAGERFLRDRGDPGLTDFQRFVRRTLGND